jgi:hypothetical protein
VCFRGGKAPTRLNLGVASSKGHCCVLPWWEGADEAQSRCSFSEQARAAQTQTAAGKRAGTTMTILENAVRRQRRAR